MTRLSKCSLGNIFFGHEYLIVSCIAIHETDNSMSGCSINQQIGNWHWTTIHQRGFAKISKVNANTKLPILSINRDNIRNPFGIPTLPNKLRFKKFGYFGLNIRKNIRITSACWLLMRLKSRLNRQPMFNN